jgi:Domain of unknown function (DUF4365)
MSLIGPKCLTFGARVNAQTVISKTEEHEINRTGKRLLREALEPLSWVVNDVQEDYRIDCNVQVFEGKSPTGAWFHVQLKSSASANYAADRSFISPELSIDHAKHYALDMREPLFLIHVDVISRQIYWSAPQLDRKLASVLVATGAKFITVRIPTGNQLPETAPVLLANLDAIYLSLANRELTSASNQSFAESIKHLPNQEPLHRAFQERNDTLKLQRIAELFRQRKYAEARPRADLVLADPDSSLETKFWAEIQLEGIDFAVTLHSGKPQSELPKITLAHAKALQKLTKSGPMYLKFFALIARQAAELELLTHENTTLYMMLHQYLDHGGNPMRALHLYARRSAVTRKIVFRYNRCLRLARYAANYPDRWMLGRALGRIITGVGRYLVTVRGEGNVETEKAFAQSALQICKLSAWICNETGDAEGVVVAILNSLMTTHSKDSDAYRWASEVAGRLSDPAIRADALQMIERTEKRWRGEKVDGDFHGDPAWQIIQNMATNFGIDLSNESDPLVRGLRIAARDNSPERILAHCEHLLVSQGATGPIARQIHRLLNVTTASSKVVHCTLHDYHIEGKDQDSAYAEFKRTHCDSCPDGKPRAEGWRYTDQEQREIQARHLEFVMRLAGTPSGLRYTNQD